MKLEFCSVTEFVYRNLYSASVANYINLSLFSQCNSHSSYALKWFILPVAPALQRCLPAYSKCHRYTNPHFHYSPTRSLLLTLSWPPSYAVGVPGSGPTLCRMPLWTVLLKVLGKST